jgi:hypothetical protein
MKIVTGCPSARPIAEKEMPVFPLVASMRGSPGWSAPSPYARSRMWSAMRSLMLPVMLRFSAFA